MLCLPRAQGIGAGAVLLEAPELAPSTEQSLRRRAGDLLPRWIGMVPLRCNLCERRFYRFRKGLDLLPNAPAASDAAPTSQFRAER